MCVSFLEMKGVKKFKFMRSLFSKLLVLALLLTFTSKLLAEEAKKEEAKQAAPTKEATLKEKKASPCNCLDTKDFSVTNTVAKAYRSVEEDEWKKAIQACKDAVTSIKEHEKKCKCDEVPEYRKIVEAFQKYAEGGEHLDSAEEPDCPFALKVYDEAIKKLGESIPKIFDEKTRKDATNIKEYAQEERQFVQDECSST